MSHSFAGRGCERSGRLCQTSEQDGVAGFDPPIVVLYDTSILEAPLDVEGKRVIIDGMHMQVHF